MACSQVVGAVFGVEALSSRYFCPWGSRGGVFSDRAFSAGAPGE